MAKKKKPQKAAVPFEERLQLCWEKGDWAAFVSLYMRTPREKTESAPAARHFGDALFNCMTTALFAEDDLSTACMAAETILKEDLPAVLRNCARTTLDFRRLRDEGFSPLTPLEQEDVTISPYGRLRREMESLVKEQRKPRTGSPRALLEKLTKQYAALPSSKTITRFNTCCKTAAELREATASLPCADLFQIIAVLIECIRDLHAPGHHFRRTTALLFDIRIDSLPIGPRHPLVTRLWEYLFRAGRARYGKEWELQARALCIIHTLSAEESRIPQQKRMQVGALVENLSPHELLVIDKGELATLLMKFPRVWDPLEAYFLDLTTILSTSELGAFPSIEPTEVITIMERIIRNGRKLRPEAPLPTILRTHLLRLLPEFPVSSLRELLRAGLSVEDLPAATLVRMACAPWWKSAEMERALAHRLPLTIPVADMLELQDEEFPGNPTIQTLTTLERILTQESFISVAELWFWRVVFRSYHEGVDGKKLAAQSWAGVRAEVLQKYQDIMPTNTLVNHFCALSRDAKRYTLSSDSVLTEAFFKAFPKSPTERHFTLYTWLLTWPDIPLPFLRRMGELTYSYCKKGKCWEEVYHAVSAIQNKPRREMIARDIVEMWTIVDRSKRKDPLREQCMAKLWKL